MPHSATTSPSSESTFFGLAELFLSPSPKPSSPLRQVGPHEMTESSAATTVCDEPQLKLLIAQPRSSSSGFGYIHAFCDAARTRPHM